jgi:hypothetical protein
MWHDGRFRSFERLDPLTEMAAELVIRLERVTGIEPAYSAWEADVLPLNYTRRTGRPGRGGLVVAAANLAAVPSVRHLRW